LPRPTRPSIDCYIRPFFRFCTILRTIGFKRLTKSIRCKLNALSYRHLCLQVCRDCLPFLDLSLNVLAFRSFYGCNNLSRSRNTGWNAFLIAQSYASFAAIRLGNLKAQRIGCISMGLLRTAFLFSEVLYRRLYNANVEAHIHRRYLRSGGVGMPAAVQSPGETRLYQTIFPSPGPPNPSLTRAASCSQAGPNQPWEFRHIGVRSLSNIWMVLSNRAH